MKHNWTYKRFDEVFDLQMGKTPDRKNLQFFEGNNVWVSIRDMVSKEIDDSNEHISDSAVTSTNIRKVKKGTVIMSFKLTVGKCAIAARDLYTNEAIMAFNLKEGFNISSDFLYYYLLGYRWEGANKAVMGMTLNKATISQHKIGYPNPSEQRSIVDELDKINELIMLKKSQLSDLDCLIQSIFFDMFGDPIINEMGWTTQKLEELTKSEGGGTPSKSKPEYWNGDIIWVSSKDMKSTYISDSLIHITQEGVNNSPAHILPIGTILIVNRSGILKHTLPLAITTKEVTINQDIKALVVNSDKITNLYLLYCLKAFSPFLLSKVKAVTVDSIDYAIIKKLEIPLPPLTLQQSFAARITAIEGQKQQIAASINDLETLLASRMQYWFE